MDNQVELITKFFEGREEGTGTQAMLLDLYRAITCYRIYGSIEEFLRINPELECSRLDVQELWKQFDAMSPEDLSEVSLELLKDI